jgi:hypothetical protein
MPSHWANVREGLAVRPRVDEATLPQPYKPLGLLVGPFSHRQETLCLSTKSWGQVNIFPLAVGARNPKQLQTSTTSTCGLGFSQTTTVSSFTFHVDGDAYLSCPIRASIEEVMPV